MIGNYCVDPVQVVFINVGLKYFAEHLICYDYRRMRFVAEISPPLFSCRLKFIFLMDLVFLLHVDVFSMLIILKLTQL